MEYFLRLFLFYTISLLLVSFTLGLTSKTETHSTANFKLQEKFYNMNQVQQDVKWEGWVKFFNFEQSEQMFKPQKFFVNDKFYRQKVKKSDLFTKKDNVYINIPDRFHFYGKLSSTALNIYSERDIHYKKSVDSLDVRLIRPLNLNDLLNSSIKNLGSFVEGHCISVETYLPKDFDEKFIPVRENKNSIPNFWIICLDSDEIKQKLIESLISIKAEYQKKLDEENKLKEPEKEEIPMVEDVNKTIERYKGPDANDILDGYLVRINDCKTFFNLGTKCTLKCGGGLSYQQWRCIPPKKGGKPCVGELVRTRPCNTKPCPGFSEGNSDMMKSTKEKDKLIVESKVINNPVIKSQYFTSHPQQYVPCQIKENDVLYRKQVDDKLLIIPSRIVMNTNVIILYPNADYSKTEYTLKLKKTNMFKSKLDNCCIVVKSEISQFEFCSLGEECGTPKDPVFFRKWYNAFKLFQNKCYNKLEHETAARTLDEKETLQKTIGATIRMDMDYNEVHEKEKVLNQKIQERTQSLRNDKLLDSQNLEMKVLDREVEVEEKIKKEEYLKAKERTKLLLDQMNKEKVKKDKLEKAIEEKEEEEVKIQDSNKLTQALSDIKNETKSTVLSKREKLKKKIKEIRLRANRRQAMIEQQINLIRGKMTSSLIKANKKGNKEKCKSAKSNQTSMNTYCDENVVEDLNSNIECKKELNFCFVCCDNEFGKLNMEEREACYNFCGSSDIKGLWTDKSI